MKKLKALFTGGHITPAIAVADELKKLKPDIEIVFVGRQSALEGSNTPSAESPIVKERGFRFIPLIAGRVTRTLTINTVVGLFKIPIGFVHAFFICASERPDVIVSFGGYVALPVVISGWLLGISSVTHEQTRAPGLANRIIGYFTKEVFVSFPETAKQFPTNKTLVSGLPMRDAIFHPPNAPPFFVDSSKPLLFVSGGSTGSSSVNNQIFSELDELLKLFTVIHQTGHLDARRADAVAQKLSNEDRKRYTHIPYIHESEYSWVLNNATIVMGRSGANTVGEIATLGKVALFIPLPWSGGGEQYLNAKYLEGLGTSRILNQSDFSEGSVVTHLKAVLGDYKTMEQQAKIHGKTLPHDAALKIAQRIEAILPDA